MSRRKRKNNFINFLLIILIIIMGVIIVFAVKDRIGNKSGTDDTQIKEEQNTKKEDKKEEKKNDTTKEKEKEKTNVDTPITEEEQNQKERKNRDTSDITLDIIGDDEITVSKGSSFVDPGFTATYSDGTDASSEVSVDNTVDINNEGTYTITYSVGNQIIIRRVIVK